MSKTIPGIPEYLTRDQWAAMFEQFGFDPMNLVEVRFAPDGVHALVASDREDGAGYFDRQAGKPIRSRIYIPVRDEPDDERTTRVTPVKN